MTSFGHHRPWLLEGVADREVPVRCGGESRTMTYPRPRCEYLGLNIVRHSYSIVVGRYGGELIQQRDGRCPVTRLGPRSFKSTGTSHSGSARHVTLTGQVPCTTPARGTFVHGANLHYREKVILEAGPTKPAPALLASPRSPPRSPPSPASTKIIPPSHASDIRPPPIYAGPPDAHNNRKRRLQM